MVSRSVAAKRSWTVARNSSNNLRKSNGDGKMFRKSMYNLTGKAKYKESNFEKISDSGDFRGYSVSAIRSDITLARKVHEKRMRKAWLRSKKGGNTASFKEFKKANRPLEEDIEEIRESFNSP